MPKDYIILSNSSIGPLDHLLILMIKFAAFAHAGHRPGEMGNRNDEEAVLREKMISHERELVPYGHRGKENGWKKFASQALMLTCSNRPQYQPTHYTTPKTQTIARKIHQL